MGAVTRTAPQASHWRTGTAVSAAGARRYCLFQTAAHIPAQGLALVVMLHGCNQDARGFAASTRMNQLAQSAGFVVLYPEQDRFANAHACWNWFDTRSGRAQKEASSILAVLDQVCAKYPIDTGRIVLAGMSAGASMAALVALQDPARFLALALHSGVGPGMADSTASALAAMRGRSPKQALHAAQQPSLWPPLLVIQGTRDTVVAPANGELTVRRWATALGARETAPRAVQRGARYVMTIQDWKLGTRVVASLAEVAGLGHAWSGGAATQAFSDPQGPDASRMVWSFAQRAYDKRQRQRQH